ncbi:MAG: chorismate--pyruvate lyase [Cryomorphaceae bacterium]
MFQSHNPNRLSDEPPWRPVARFTAGELPQRDRHWLLDDGSLTSRLMRLSAGDFRVDRLYQGWQVPKPSERRLLDLPPRELALIREVVLLASEQSVVFARSVFPLSSLTGTLSHLRRLQTKPLGAILFKHPGMRRSPFELASIPGHSDYLPQPLHQSEPAWGRRCRFIIEDKSLMVSEVFLHSFQPWLDIAPVHRAQRGKVSAANVQAKQ